MIENFTYTVENPDALRREIESLRAQVADLDRRATDYAAMNDRQSGMITKLEADAKRYRWLRNEHDIQFPVCRVSWKRLGIRNSGDWVNLIDGKGLDAAIDAAMGES